MDRLGTYNGYSGEERENAGVWKKWASMIVRERTNALLLRELPTKRIEAHSPDALAASELIAVLLDGTCRKRSPLETAQEILGAFQGSLRAAAQGNGKLRAIAGVRAAARIAAALELGRRLAAEAREEGAPVRWPRDVYELMSPKLEDLPVEEFHVLILDSQHRLSRDVTVTRGLLNSSLVHPREVFREAITGAAAAIILVHNHPSGDPTPSPDDRAVTEQLVASGRVLDVPVQDHVIIGRGRYISFAEAGLL